MNEREGEKRREETGSECYSLQVTTTDTPVWLQRICFFLSHSVDRTLGTSPYF